MSWIQQLLRRCEVESDEERRRRLRASRQLEEVDANWWRQLPVIQRMCCSAIAYRRHLVESVEAGCSILLIECDIQGFKVVVATDDEQNLLHAMSVAGASTVSLVVERVSNETAAEYVDRCLKSHLTSADPH